MTSNFIIFYRVFLKTLFDIRINPKVSASLLKEETTTAISAIKIS